MVPQESDLGEAVDGHGARALEAGCNPSRLDPSRVVNSSALPPGSPAVVSRPEDDPWLCVPEFPLVCSYRPATHPGPRPGNPLYTKYATRMPAALSRATSLYDGNLRHSRGDRCVKRHTRAALRTPGTGRFAPPAHRPGCRGNGKGGTVRHSRLRTLAPSWVQGARNRGVGIGRRSLPHHHRPPGAGGAGRRRGTQPPAPLTRLRYGTRKRSRMTVRPKLEDGADVGRHRDSMWCTAACGRPAARQDGSPGGGEQGATQSPTDTSQRQYKRGVAGRAAPRFLCRGARRWSPIGRAPPGSAP